MIIDIYEFGPCPYAKTTQAVYWFWRKFDLFETNVLLGGTYANKSGFHNDGDTNNNKWPGNYSVRDAPNKSGPWWKTYSSAIDLTFPDAQAGNYKTIDKYTSRLMASAKNASDPRLDLVLFEFYGQDDDDHVVEGWNEYKEEAVTSDSSHLWHLHLSFLRNKCGDPLAMWALLTVLYGWSVAQWRESLEEDVPLTPDEIDKIARRVWEIDGIVPAPRDRVDQANQYWSPAAVMAAIDNLGRDIKAMVLDGTTPAGVAGTVAGVSRIKLLAEIQKVRTTTGETGADLVGLKETVTTGLSAISVGLAGLPPRVAQEVVNALTVGSDEELRDALMTAIGPERWARITRLS